MSYRPKHVLPKPEEWNIDNEYAITINPSDQKDDRRKEFPDRVSACWKQISKTLSYNSSIESLHLHPEVSPYGRVHFHGTIKINNIIDFYVGIIYSLSNEATICIKPIEDRKEWDSYCTKQSEIFTKYHYNLPVFKLPKAKAIPRDTGILSYLKVPCD